MSDVYDALNSIQRTPLKVNKFVLDWINYFIENQVTWADDLDLPVLCQRNVEDHVRRPADADVNEEALFWYQKDCTEFYRDEQMQAGKRAGFYQMIGLAEKYVDQERFYVPWQGDRRMRVYPASKLNLQGHDYTKALLKFADGVELGKHGLKWLEIHMANLFGVDKCSFKQRRAWVREHATEIKLLAVDPLASRDFWTQADSPWQALAVAKELSEAWSMDNPKKFVSYIPVALDGSCSGLQILGAALRCEETGQHVNLIPKDAPADIYGVVSGIVEKELRGIVGDMDRKEVLKTAEAETYKAWRKKVEHANDGDWSFVIERVKGSTAEDDTKVIKELRKTYFKYTEAWAWLQFGLNRSTVKRNVMTYCYGSEQFGFTEQCLEDIIQPAYKAHRKAIASGQHSEWYFNGTGNRAAQLLASHVYPAVKRTVLRAAQAMDWMQKTAKLIAKENRPVRWTTPLGFPVLQEYRKTKEAKTQCYFQGSRRILSVNLEQQNYDPHKAATAVAPNVVHSLDSTHLQSVVNMARDELGVQHFALVHDSFGTHAGNTEGFFGVIRKALIDLFTEHDVFQDLYDEFKAQIHPDKRHEIPDLPEYGDLSLEQIADSLYAFA
ncbi:hypothetical protein BZG05_14845 [Salinivibrio kushneri]|nr:hypothetical protein BZG05_14845 [Salinivibrio kushneri]